MLLWCISNCFIRTTKTKKRDGGADDFFRRFVYLYLFIYISDGFVSRLEMENDL